MDLSALAAKARAGSPMACSASVPILPDLTLYIDGDGLAYYCAGNDETDISKARAFVRDKIEGTAAAVGAQSVKLLLTASGGHKGHRYAIARAKPYQGQRAGARRPKNWQALRQLLEAGAFGDVQNDADREADDRFGQYGHTAPMKTAISTQDKDMRMVPGYHVDWKDNRVFYLGPNVYEASFNDKVYGLKWFWLQTLQGDTADNIPGLPLHNGKKIGEVGAANVLAGTTCNEEAFEVVLGAYRTYYNDRAMVELLEQACLLWMRRGESASWFDVGAIGGPMYRADGDRINDHLYEAWKEINQRVQTAIDYNALSAQGL